MPRNLLQCMNRLDEVASEKTFGGDPLSSEAPDFNQGESRIRLEIKTLAAFTHPQVLGRFLASCTVRLVSRKQQSLELSVHS